ncbi:MAG: hypothetical protein PUJ78_00620 [Coriobacteriaceae bacterium]|nr:hypothetical protein [Coriobacteriaceae bacterium]
MIDADDHAKRVQRNCDLPGEALAATCVQRNGADIMAGSAAIRTGARGC